MPMTQEDIREHYETSWKKASESPNAEVQPRLGFTVHDLVTFPQFENLVRDLGIRVNGGRVLDVGSGGGRWIQFFLDRYRPQRLMGIDFTHSSIKCLEKKYNHQPDIRLEFRHANIADEKLDLGEQFDLINLASVLYHMPEPAFYMQALRNLRKLVAPEGRIVMNEFMPRNTMRTEWMLVRSRYEIEHAAKLANLRIANIQACSFFTCDPMGLDGPDQAVRHHFHSVKSQMKMILDSKLDEQSKQFFVNFLAGVDHALLAFCRERLADVELPGSKFVVLAPDS